MVLTEQEVCTVLQKGQRDLRKSFPTLHSIFNQILDLGCTFLLEMLGTTIPRAGSIAAGKCTLPLHSATGNNGFPGIHQFNSSYTFGRFQSCLMVHDGFCIRATFFFQESFVQSKPVMLLSCTGQIY